jgi:predicted Zn finger-like uncharacterized protein
VEETHLHGGRAGFPWYSRGFQPSVGGTPVIIACTQCHTRFKVPDGKVTARGLKVRCSRCRHTFRIYPDSAAERGDDPAPAAARPRGPDPFESFGPEGTSEMEKTPSRSSTVSALLARMDPANAEEDFDVDVAGVEPASTEPAWNFPPAPSRPAEAVTATATAAVAWELEPPGAPPPAVVARAPVPVRPLPPEPDPPSMENTQPELDIAPVAGPPASLQPQRPSSESGLAGLFEDHPLDVSPPRPQAGSSPGPAPGPPGTVPLSDDLASLAGFTPAWGLAAPSRALSMDGTLSNHTPSLSPASDPESPPPAAQFGGAGTVLDVLPSLEPPDLPAHGELQLDPGTGTPGWSEVSPTSLGGNEIELASDLPSVELDRHPPPEPEAALAADLSWSVPATSAPPAPEPALPGGDWSLAPPGPPPPALASPAQGAPAVAGSSGSGFDDPFSDFSPSPRPPRAPAPNAVVLDEAPHPTLVGPDHGFFEMPSGTPAPEPSGALLPDIPEAAEPVAAPASLVTSGPLPAISKPPGRARLGLQDSERPGTARRVSAAILNVGLAALLLLVVVGVVSSWATAGRVEGAALSPRRLLQALRPGTGVSPVEVTPGTYETRSGRWLLYVRGRVLNRGAPPGRVRVRAEVWDGAQAVKAGETLAGAIATPEELWRAATPADVEALRSRLQASAKPVPDGQEADFLVLLDEAPWDLSGLRLKVTASVDR